MSILNKSYVYRFIGVVGEIGIFLAKVASSLFKRPIFFRNMIIQLAKIGFDSLWVVLFTAFATGMVLSLQIGSVLESRVEGMVQYIGWGISMSFVRELGPVLSALMITGRVGSAIAAEIGTMKVTEQIDALVSLSIEPIQYLVVPRFVASLLAFPLLTFLSDILGIIGGSLISYFSFNLSFFGYYEQVQYNVATLDILTGCFKSVVFGGAMALVSCFQGFKTQGGAAGVGQRTTKAVVVTSLIVVFCDYLLNILFIQILDI